MSSNSSFEGWPPQAREGLRLYARGAYHEAHDAWEEAWRAATDPVAREVLQGLTQLAVACLHAQRGNARGAIRVGQRALRHLAAAPWQWRGLDLAGLRAALALWLTDQIQGRPDARCPRLQPARSHGRAAPARTPRSFVLREGRLTPAQRRALERLGPRYILPATQPVEVRQVFGRSGPVVLDIGFGDGEALVAQARAQPETLFLGSEVYRPGVGALLRALERTGADNVRVFLADAWQVLTQALPDASLDGVQIFFPDPWPKRRHRKRRLIQPAFADLLARKLKPGGWLHLATDWPDYAVHMAVVLDTHPAFRNANPAGGPHPPARARRRETKFERKARAEGRQAQDFFYRRRPHARPPQPEAAG